MSPAIPKECLVSTERELYWWPTISSHVPRIMIVSGDAAMVRSSRGTTARLPREPHAYLHQATDRPPLRIHSRCWTSLWALPAGLGAVRPWTGRRVSPSFVNRTACQSSLTDMTDCFPTFTLPAAFFLLVTHVLHYVFPYVYRYISNRKSHEEPKFVEPKDSPKFGQPQIVSPPATSHSLHTNPFTQSPDR